MAARRRWPRPNLAENRGLPALPGGRARSLHLTSGHGARTASARTHSLGKKSMKAIASGLLALGLLAVQISEADAAACAAGRYHAGCVGPRGAVATAHRPTATRRCGGAPCLWRALLLSCGRARLPLSRQASIARAAEAPASFAIVGAGRAARIAVAGRVGKPSRWSRASPGSRPRDWPRAGMTRFHLGGSRRNWPWSPISIN